MKTFQNFKKFGHLAELAFVDYVRLSWLKSAGLSDHSEEAGAFNSRTRHYDENDGVRLSGDRDRDTEFLLDLEEMIRYSVEHDKDTLVLTDEQFDYYRDILKLNEVEEVTVATWGVWGTPPTFKRVRI